MENLTHFKKKGPNSFKIETETRKKLGSALDPSEKERLEELSDEEKLIERFNKSLLSQAISDPVIMYAVEKCNFEFLRKVKDGEMTDLDYRTMKHEMKKNWWEDIKFQWSFLQKISEDYVYYLALQKVDEKMLSWLSDNTLTWNYKKQFAEQNWWDVIMWWWVAQSKYHKWLKNKLQ